jgi:cellulose synthase/poly-beta-1,6-N-acetylglucosamine synthase-like glycosyltransferase
MKWQNSSYGKVDEYNIFARKTEVEIKFDLRIKNLTNYFGMKSIEIIFWALLFVIFYTYLGYGILAIMPSLRPGGCWACRNLLLADVDYEPEVTLFIAAYNEKDFVEAKMKNTRELEYPKEKLQVVWVTDGSDDGTPDELKKFEECPYTTCPSEAGKLGP